MGGGVENQMNITDVNIFDFEFSELDLTSLRLSWPSPDLDLDLSLTLICAGLESEVSLILSSSGPDPYQESSVSGYVQLRELKIKDLNLSYTIFFGLLKTEK